MKNIIWIAQGVVGESTITAAEKNFINVDRKLYLYHDSLDISQFSEKYIKLKNKIDGLNNSQEKYS